MEVNQTSGQAFTMSKLTVTFNDVPQLEYDRDKQLEDQQLLYLEKMDQKMNLGITLGEQHIDNPDLNQRSQFVAANLAHAIKTNNDTQMASLCSYIAVRMPDIQQLSIKEQDDGAIEIDFRFEAAKSNVVMVAPPTRNNS
jgi:hypothetical protein